MPGVPDKHITGERAEKAWARGVPKWAWLQGRRNGKLENAMGGYAHYYCYYFEELNGQKVFHRHSQFCIALHLWFKLSL
jgi:hypothetical protein